MLISCLNPIPVGLFISYIGCVMALPGISGDNEHKGCVSHFYLTIFLA